MVHLKSCVYAQTVRWMISFSRSLSLTTFTRAVWAGLPGLSHFFLCCCSGDSGRWSHFWKCLFPGQLCLFVTWWRTDNDLSFNTSASLLQLSTHHHKWLRIDGIHGAKLEQPDFLDAAYNFLVTVLARCQGSNWQSISGWFTLISFIWVCLKK